MSVDAHGFTAPLSPIKPRLRGWIHAGTFPLAVAAGIVLVALSDDAKSRVACGVFALTAAMLFGTSGVYHRGNWGPRGEAVLRRLDHANIFLIIAGTYTPLTILLLGKSDQILLWAVWIGALAGIGFRVFWIGAPRWLYTPIYVVLGWAAVFYLPEFMREGGVAVVVLVIVGGVLYSLGAVVYGIKRPNPSPQWFGFHEVFHAFTLLAFASHFVAVALVALG
ncbi:PAQR family membrane homeostasis protein TrhA [Embleya hyalina]|uniref:DNA-binding protein n=1 Tax=Embleya hyalina TaxID=516124 RepID=A0A401YWM8_9ACTN|nr:hemolysin III family protein [Embleya hyalina]GCD99008.1 DNA-binding protein [Embleya hyalina]